MRVYIFADPENSNLLKKAIRERDEDETLEMLAWEASLKLKMLTTTF